MIDDKTEPAFPQNQETQRWAGRKGMSLRDYFAANTLPAMVTAAETHPSWSRKDVADRCYLMADAMLEARK